MLYKQFRPDSSLANYIDAYWTAKGDAMELKTEKILPDGCVDIIFNLGSDCKTENGNFLMKSEKAYFVGTMTKCKETKMHNETHLLGIRFKPAAISAFYKFIPLHQVTNQTIELEKPFAPDLKKSIQHSANYFNQFFSDKLTKPNHFLLQIVECINQHKGQIKVEALAQKHFTTVRQLERSFKQYIGISPKEFINFVRFQFTLPLIQNKTSNRSLLDIAFDCGYYDHSHLTNEIKRYTGITPSQL